MLHGNPRQSQGLEPSLRFGTYTEIWLETMAH